MARGLCPCNISRSHCPEHGPDAVARIDAEAVDDVSGVGAWMIQRMRVGEGNNNAEASLQNALANGWEPFAVTNTPLGAYTYHLRRFVDSDPYLPTIADPGREG